MLNFFKRKKRQEFSKGPVKNRNLIREIAVSNIGISSIYPETKPLDPRKIEKMLHNITISTPILSLTRGVCSRRIELRSKNGPQDDNLIRDINGRFGKIENWQGYLKELALTPYYGFTVFEKIYNKDFTLKKFVKVPRSRVRYDNATRKWYLTGVIDEEMTPDKFQISVWEGSLEYPKGKSLFSYGISEAFDDYNELEAKVRGIQAKYGEIIPVFGFDEMEAESEDGRNQVKARAESVKAMTGGNVMAIPLGGNFSLKDSFFFISLSDLKIEMHKILLERLEKKIEKFIKGSVFSEGETGSYSRDSVQQIEKEKIEDDISVFVTGELREVLKYDGLILNYPTEGLYWVAELDEGEEVKEELEKKKAETISLKIETLNKINNLGYKISKAKAAEIMGVKESDLEEVTTGIGAEFSDSKKKIDFLRDKSAKSVKSLDENIESFRTYFTREAYKQALEQFQKKKSIEQLKDGFSLDFSYLQEKMTIASLIGAMEVFESSSQEFSESLDPFKMKYEEAISAILERQPVLYNKLDYITEEVRARYTWVKKSTELETTKKLIGNLHNSLESGRTFKEWIKNSETVLKKTGFGENGWYLNLVWRNNIHSAYNAGAYIQQEENKENKPFGLYDAIEDGRESDICKALNGKVYPLDHEFWTSFMPPNHHGCRSRRIALSREDLREYGLKISKTIPESIGGLKSKMGDFVGNPASFKKNLQKIISHKEKEIEKIYNKAIQLDFTSIKNEKFRELYKKIFKNVPEDILKTIKPLMGELDVQYTRNISCYRPGRWLVELENENRVTALHEFGHFIDNVMAWKSTKVEAVSKYSSHISYDVFNPTKLQAAIENTMKSFMRTSKNKARPLEIKKHILENFTEEELYKREFAGIQDILNGLTKGRVGLYYGHSNAYWKRPGAPHHESFANMFQLYSTRDTIESKRCIEVMEKFLPDMWDEFKKVIKEGA